MNIEAIRNALIASRATIDSVLAQLDQAPCDDKKWMTVKEAAQFTGESVDVIRSKARSGVLESKSTPHGGKIWVRI